MALIAAVATASASVAARNPTEVKNFFFILSSPRAETETIAEKVGWKWEWEWKWKWKWEKVLNVMAI